MEKGFYGKVDVTMNVSPKAEAVFVNPKQRESGFFPEGTLLHTPQNRRALASVYGLQEALADGRTLEGRVTLCDGAHDLHVNLGCMSGIIPRTEGALGIESGAVRDIALISRVGKPVAFRVTGFEEDESGRTRAVLSRRAVQQDCMTQFIRTLCPGDVIASVVTHLESFGVFADIGAGLSALMPIDSVSVSRIPHPNVRFVPGQQIRAVVKNIDAENRVTLSHKELLGTWAQNAAPYEAGQTVTGIVRSVETYGVFVELAPNLAGLAEYTESVEPGQGVSVYIKSILPERMKLKLIIVDTFPPQEVTPPIRYFTEDTRIDHWVYSPPSCEKTIETVF